MNIPRLTIFSVAGAMALALACLMFFIKPADATTLIYKNFDDLVTEAEAIVAGTVRQAESHYGPGEIICTFVTLTDLLVIHGDYDKNTLVLRLQGGYIAPHGQVVVGSPKFNQGERVLIFLRGNGKLRVPIVGWTQGVFRINTDPVAKEDLIADYTGNRIFGIESNDLIKDQSRSKVVGATDVAIVSSDKKNGNGPEMEHGYPQNRVTRPWSVSEFINLISDRIIMKQKPSAVVKSVSVMDFSNMLSSFKTVPLREASPDH